MNGCVAGLSYNAYSNANLQSCGSAILVSTPRNRNCSTIADCNSS